MLYADIWLSCLLHIVISISQNYHAMLPNFDTAAEYMMRR